MTVNPNNPPNFVTNPNAAIPVTTFYTPTAGGTNGQMLFNDTGSVNGSSMTFDVATGKYVIPASSSGDTLTIYSSVTSGGVSALALIGASTDQYSAITLADQSSATYNYQIVVGNPGLFFYNDLTGQSPISFLSNDGVLIGSPGGSTYGLGSVNASTYYINGLVNFDAEAQSSSCSFHINDVANSGANFFGYNYGLFTNIGAYPTLSFCTGNDPSMTSTTMELTEGLVMTGAAGGDMGLGTINAAGFYVNGNAVSFPAAPAYGSATNAMQINNGSNAFGATNLYSSYIVGGPHNSEDFYNSLNWFNGTPQKFPWFSGCYSTIVELVDPYYGTSNSLTTGYFYGTTNAYPGLSIQSGCYNDGNNWVFDGAPDGGYPSQFVISPDFYLPAFTWYTSNAPGDAGSEVPFVQAAAIEHDGGMYLSSATGGSLGIGTFNAIAYYVNGVPVATGVLTVATLPAATAGARSFVSDSTVVATGNFGATVVGSGLYTVPVWSDGSTWYIG